MNNFNILKNDIIRAKNEALEDMNNKTLKEFSLDIEMDESGNLTDCSAVFGMLDYNSYYCIENDKIIEDLWNLDTDALNRLLSETIDLYNDHIEVTKFHDDLMREAVQGLNWEDAKSFCISYTDYIRYTNEVA